MRANYPHGLSKKQIDTAIKVGREEAAKQAEDIARRAQYMWMCAMLNAGLSARTVKRVAKELEHVTAKYGELKADGVADWAMVHELQAAGIDVPMPQDEL